MITQISAPEMVDSASAEAKPAWTMLSLPKTNNRQLAQYYVDQGWVARIEDIYVELSPEQIAVLDKAVDDHKKSKSKAKHHTPAWAVRA